MKKILTWILSLMLVLSLAAAAAETGESLFKTLSGLEWTFSSGVGAWSTDLQIHADGSFSGEFHDSNMGEIGDGYPDGTVYICIFSGKMSFIEQVEENLFKIRIDELNVSDEPDSESIEDGIRFVTSEPYGLSKGDEMLLYTPGTPIETLSEEMQIWAHVLDAENRPSALETWFLSSEKNDSGFVGYQTVTYLSNPWVDLTAEQLMEASGLTFGVPEGAENIIYRYMQSDNLAEMQFTLDGDEYCAKIQPASLKKGELLDISGLYYEWENEEDIMVAHCNGTIAQAKTGSADRIERCLWYDFVPGVMYSLSVSTTELNGLDLTAVAEQVYIPMQGND